MNPATMHETKDSNKSVALPVHEKTYRHLRELILFGDLAPGQAVTINGLCEALDAGMTPVREAIRRLLSVGALDSLGNRRVRVPILTTADIQEIIYARQCLDPHLALRACQFGTVEGFDRLSEIDRQLDEAIATGDQRGYLRWNYRFHNEIYELAEAPILADMARSLWLRFGPSLRVIADLIGELALPDQHRMLLDAFRARDAEAAARAIREDVLQGMEQISRNLHP